MNFSFKPMFLGALLSAPMMGHAGTIDAIQMLRDFTVISLGDLDAGSESEGPVYVGGDLNSNGYVVNGDGLPGGTVDGAGGALIVGGAVQGGNVTVNHGDIFANQITSNLNNNGGGSITTGQSIDAGAVTTAFETLSSDLSQLADTGDVTIGGDSNNPTISSNANGLAVLNVSQTFFENQNASFNNLFLDAYTTLLINVAGTAIDMKSNVNAESNNVIVNFFEATTLDYAKTFGFNILAPFAHITADVGGSNNSVVGASIFQRTEFRPKDGQNFTGMLPAPTVAPVPLPAAGWMLIAGVGAMTAVGRRRRKAA